MKAAVLAVPAALALLVTVPLVGCSSDEGAAPASEGCVDKAAAPLTLCAKGPILEGIDVSVWQGDVDWAKVKESGRTFAFARISNGLLKPDTKFAANWPAMKKAGLVRGAYQYFRPGQDPRAQAQAVLDALEAEGGLDAGDLPPVIDVETTDDQPPAAVQAAAKAWLDVVEAKIGRKPIVYTAAYMSPTIGQALVDYPLWVAHYTTGCPSIPDGWSSWRFWQRSDKGTVPGITGPVDLNTFDGTAVDLAALTLVCKPGDVACANADAGAPPPFTPPPPPKAQVDKAPVPPSDPCATR